MHQCWPIQNLVFTVIPGYVDCRYWSVENSELEPGQEPFIAQP
jgi:hypothetical protein